MAQVLSDASRGGLCGHGAPHERRAPLRRRGGEGAAHRRRGIAARRPRELRRLRSLHQPGRHLDGTAVGQRTLSRRRECHERTAAMKSQFHLELGMPHLGRNNLSESSLFKATRTDRWKQIEIAGKVPTSLIQDDAGSRLYATFFFLEVHFAPDHPLSAHGENETMHFYTDL